MIGQCCQVYPVGPWDHHKARGVFMIGLIPDITDHGQFLFRHLGSDLFIDFSADA